MMFVVYLPMQPIYTIDCKRLSLLIGTTRIFIYYIVVGYVKYDLKVLKTTFKSYFLIEIYHQKKKMSRFVL